MSEHSLGRLQKVDLRKVWEHEAEQFTPWLAEEENIALLGDTIGIDLEVEAQEKAVGPFSADILCKDTANDHWVLIENQLEKTDHTHLGQLLTYAAGLDAVSIIWVAHRFTDEHRAALDWLNEISADGMNFFGLEIELWQIEDSLMAPKFNVVCQPNDWSKTIRTSTSAGQLTEMKQLQLDFWIAFKDFLEDNDGSVRATKPQPQNWMPHSVGRNGFSLCSVASAWDSVRNSYTGEIRVDLDIHHKNSKEFFRLLEKQRETIERQVGQSLTWYNPEDRQVCRIYTRKSVDITDKERWAESHVWLKENLEKFYEVFSPLVKELNLTDGETGDGLATEDTG